MGTVRPVTCFPHVFASRALSLATRRARELAAVRPPRRHRSGHRVGQDRRRDRRRLRSVAAWALRAGRRSVACPHGAVARSPVLGAPRHPYRPARRRRARHRRFVRRARRDPPFCGRAQADSARRERRPADRRRVSRARRPGAAPRHVAAVRRTARSHRHARTERRRGDRTAPPLLRRYLLPLRVRRPRSPTASARRLESRSSAFRSRSTNAPSTSRPNNSS